MQPSPDFTTGYGPAPAAISFGQTEIIVLALGILFFGYLAHKILRPGRG